MNSLNRWSTATATDGSQIQVKLVPLQRPQNTVNGVIMVDVGQLVELENGDKFPLNLDGKSFYAGVNQLYRLK